MSQSVTPTSKPVGTTDASNATTDHTTIADIVTDDLRFIDEWAVYAELSRLSEDTIHRVRV